MTLANRLRNVNVLVDAQHRPHWLQQQCDDAADEIERLRAGIQKLLDEGAPRTVAEPYADDGKPHKGDRCPHGCYTWESCDACTDEYLAGLLAPDGET